MLKPTPEPSGKSGYGVINRIIRATGYLIQEVAAIMVAPAFAAFMWLYILISRYLA